MRVTVKMFAAARDVVGLSEVVAEVPNGATIADVRRALCKAYPQAQPLVERAMFAVDAHYAQDDDVIAENADVACIPPVSGG
jgi:molybdopterin synthase catalytic subunit/molybdopterin synthase sulfur carrier subunit